MKRIDISAHRLINALLARSGAGGVSILDSCGVGHLGSHLLIAGTDPVEVFQISNNDPQKSLSEFQALLERGLAAVFTISYDFGRKLESSSSGIRNGSAEPDIYVCLYDALVVHDYDSDETFLTGNAEGFDGDLVGDLVGETARDEFDDIEGIAPYESTFTFDEYIDAVETIKECIRRGDTYQTNLTMQLSVDLGERMTPQRVFQRLRRDHPAPFAAFIDRGDSYVVSASPERFFHMAKGKISASPIKGTRPQGADADENIRLQKELLDSEKDRAENTMIVDLLRNDLGRVCEFGGVEVTKLCDLEVHPTLCHLVSTIEGKLKDEVKFVDVLQALFPCGSITGAPKVRTMQIIDELEPNARGLSMGAIGYFIPDTGFDRLEPGFDLSVAIRTMVIRDGIATFNVGGGITIDSDPHSEYDESFLKAKALLAALGNK